MYDLFCGMFEGDVSAFLCWLVFGLIPFVFVLFF